MNKKVKNEIKSRLISILIWSCFLIFATLFYYLPRQNMTSSFAYSSGNNDGFYLEELNDGFKMESIMPVRDEVGLKGEPYKFRVVNDLDLTISYTLYFQNDASKIEDGTKKLANNYLRFQVIKNGVEQPINNLNTDGKIVIAEIEPHSSDTFDFRVWLDKEAGLDAMGKEFYGRLGLDAHQI